MDGTYTYGEWTYTLDGEGHAVVTRWMTPDIPRRIDVPAMLDGHHVVSIGNGAFSDFEAYASAVLSAQPLQWKDLSLSLPEGLKAIGDSAFQYCWFLESVELPESLETIGDSAFYDCTMLGSITIPDGVTSIGSYAFSGCKSLVSAILPRGLKAIPAHAFEACDSLKYVRLPEALETIGAGAFEDCDSLDLEIPDVVRVFCEAEES